MPIIDLDLVCKCARGLRHSARIRTLDLQKNKQCRYTSGFTSGQMCLMRHVTNLRQLGCTTAHNKIPLKVMTAISVQNSPEFGKTA